MVAGKRGVWGVGIYDNQTSCDVRDTFKTIKEAGCSTEEAIEAIVNDFRDFIDYDEDILFAVVDIQMDYNTVVFPEYMEDAKEMVANANTDRYVGFANPEERKRVLQEFLDRLKQL